MSNTNSNLAYPTITVTRKVKGWTIEADPVVGVYVYRTAGERVHGTIVYDDGRGNADFDALEYRLPMAVRHAAANLAGLRYQAPATKTLRSRAT